MTKVGVVGAFGKMGGSICEFIESDGALELSAKVGSGDDLSTLARNGSEVVVDVTTLDSARRNLPWFALHGMHAVVGTTGFSASDIEEFQRTYEAENKACFLVPNFSIAAVLMMKLAAEAAPYFDGVEIIELHHERKKDAPSGTAQTTADRIAVARTEPWAPDPTEHETVTGARGGEAAPGIRVHSVRLPGLVAHQEVLFGATGQSFTIRYDTYDRSAYAPGVIRAINAVGSLPAGVTVGLDAVL